MSFGIIYYIFWMSLLKILGVIVCVLVLCSGFEIQIQGETGVEILRDEIGNVTDA